MQTNNNSRGALSKILVIAEYLQTRCGVPKFVVNEISEIEQAAKDALAAPPRNCDLPEVAKDPWRAWLDDESNWDEDGNPKLEIHDWLLAPATEKEGGNNG